jgi:hypothetical protein
MQRKRGCAGGCEAGASNGAAFEGGGVGREENLRGIYWAVELLREPRSLRLKRSILRLGSVLSLSWGDLHLPGSFARL